MPSKGVPDRIKYFRSTNYKDYVRAREYRANALALRLLYADLESHYQKEDRLYVRLHLREKIDNLLDRQFMLLYQGALDKAKHRTLPAAKVRFARRAPTSFVEA